LSGGYRAIRLPGSNAQSVDFSRALRTSLRDETGTQNAQCEQRGSPDAVSHLDRQLPNGVADSMYIDDANTPKARVYDRASLASAVW